VLARIDRPFFPELLVDMRGIIHYEFLPSEQPTNQSVFTGVWEETPSSVIDR
jgi:hypothetical protein